MSEPKTNELIKSMIQMIKSDNVQKLREMSPSPLFNDKTHYLQSPQISNIMNKNPHTPPKSPHLSNNQSMVDDKENMQMSSAIKRITQSHLKNTLLQSIQNNQNIPQFYFPKGAKEIDNTFFDQQLVFLIIELRK